MSDELILHQAFYIEKRYESVIDGKIHEQKLVLKARTFQYLSKYADKSNGLLKLLKDDRGYYIKKKGEGKKYVPPKLLSVKSPHWVLKKTKKVAETVETVEVADVAETSEAMQTGGGGTSGGSTAETPPASTPESTSPALARYLRQLSFYSSPMHRAAELASEMRMKDLKESQTNKKLESVKSLTKKLNKKIDIIKDAKPEALSKPGNILRIADWDKSLRLNEIAVLSDKELQAIANKLKRGLAFNTKCRTIRSCTPTEFSRELEFRGIKKKQIRDIQQQFEDIRNTRGGKHGTGVAAIHPRYSRFIALDMIINNGSQFCEYGIDTINGVFNSKLSDDDAAAAAPIKDLD